MQPVAGGEVAGEPLGQAQLGEPFAVAEGDRLAARASAGRSADAPPAARRRPPPAPASARRGQRASIAARSSAGGAGRSGRRQRRLGVQLEGVAAVDAARAAHLEAVALVGSGEAHPDVAPARRPRPSAAAGSRGRGSRRRRSRRAPAAPPRPARGSRCRAAARRPTRVRCSSSTQWLGGGVASRSKIRWPSSSKLAMSSSGGARRLARRPSARRRCARPARVAAMPTSLQMPQSIATTRRPAAAAAPGVGVQELVGGDVVDLPGRRR